MVRDRDRRQDEREEDEFRGAIPRVFGTNPDNPDEGRIFVWTKMDWFERIEGESGDVAFTPIARSETELRELILHDDPSADLIELDANYSRMVSDEFIEQSPSYQDTPEYSEDEPQEEDSQQYHQHE